MTRDAYIAGLCYALPDRVVTNADLQRENPDWDMARVEAKVGIRERRIAGPEECASDLAHRAGANLIEKMGIDRSKVDAVLLCTQSPDFSLPTTACVLQDRLGLPTSCAALDFNQGCSGYVYGLYLAKGLVSSGMADNVLFLTAETYSKYIHPRDRSVRTLFGDGGTATLVTSTPQGARVGACVLGTDGAGYRNLIVEAGGARVPMTDVGRTSVTDENGSTRAPCNLFMDGQEVFNFTLKRVPPLIREVLAKEMLSQDDVQHFVFHQANAMMNEHLRIKLKIPKERAPICVERFGNTVSNTIPITLREVGPQFQRGAKVMLVGFGVGYSWGGCLLEWNQVALV